MGAGSIMLNRRTRCFAEREEWQHGFTLMELLISLSIVAVLVGLLVPATMRQIRHAQMAACAGNLRQIGVGVVLYAGEHDNYLPYGKDTGGGSWSAGNNVGLYVGCPSAADGKMINFGKVFICPGAPASEKQGGSYIANRMVMPSATSSGGIVLPVKVSSVRAPSRTVLMLDGYKATGGLPMESWGQFAASWNGPGRMPHGPNPPALIVKAKLGDTLNILFVDGHVEQGTLKKDPAGSDLLMSPDLIRDSLLGSDVTYAP